MVKRVIKDFLKAVAPKQFAAMMATRENRHGQRVMEKQGVPAIAQAFVERHGLSVQGGPFAGMTYITQSAGSSFLPKLIGSYECELQTALLQILSTTYETVIDVGCAEGFYAVGFAMRLPGRPKVFAFDINPEARALCQDLARQNSVGDQVVIGGHCNAETLQATLAGRSLVICDCEGYEVELLQPATAPALATADILVELHDLFQPNITPTILQRFLLTHEAQLIDSTDRDPTQYPILSFLSPPQQQVALSEFRNGPQQWAFLTPKKAQ